MLLGKIYGEPLDFTLAEFVDLPQVLVCSGIGRQKVLLSTSPSEISQLKNTHRSKLSRIGDLSINEFTPPNKTGTDINIK